MAKKEFTLYRGNVGVHFVIDGEVARIYHSKGDKRRKDIDSARDLYRKLIKQGFGPERPENFGAAPKKRRQRAAERYFNL